MLLISTPFLQEYDGVPKDILKNILRAVRRNKPKNQILNLNPNFGAIVRARFNLQRARRHESSSDTSSTATVRTSETSSTATESLE